MAPPRPRARRRTSLGRGGSSARPSPAGGAGPWRPASHDRYQRDDIAGARAVPRAGELELISHGTWGSTEAVCRLGKAPGVHPRGDSTVVWLDPSRPCSAWRPGPCGGTPGVRAWPREWFRWRRAELVLMSCPTTTSPTSRRAGVDPPHPARASRPRSAGAGVHTAVLGALASTASAPTRGGLVRRSGRRGLAEFRDRPPAPTPRQHAAMRRLDPQAIRTSPPGWLLRQWLAGKRATDRCTGRGRVHHGGVIARGPPVHRVVAGSIEIIGRHHRAGGRCHRQPTARRSAAAGSTRPRRAGPGLLASAAPSAAADGRVHHLRIRPSRETSSTPSAPFIRRAARRGRLPPSARNSLAAAQRRKNFPPSAPGLPLPPDRAASRCGGAPSR
jgi:hypothetical protein